jgi:hypothetical protein
MWASIISAMTSSLWDSLTRNATFSFSSRWLPFSCPFRSNAATPFSNPDSSGLLPAVEQGGMQTVLFTQLRYRRLLLQMTPQNLDFLFRRKMATLFSHGHFLQCFLH